MLKTWLALVAAFLAFVATPNAAATDDVFLIKPYLQMGPNGPSAGTCSVRIQWASRHDAADFTLETRTPGGEWSAPAAATGRRINVGTIGEHWLYWAQTSELANGEPFEYRVRQGKTVQFEASARVLNKDPQKLHAVVFGDCGAGTEPQRRIAHLAATLDPDLVMIPGDVVYSRGRLSEYLERYFPVYNADQPSAQTGAPLLRSRLTVAAAGNHDLANTDVDKYPDAMAFYWLWSMPRNGPTLTAVHTPRLTGEESLKAAMISARGDGYPNSTNYSFDSGPVHWTVLDSNTHVHWDDPALVAWVAADLKAAASASWRFVVFHHPPFNASEAHKDAQWMRMLCPVLEEGKADLVISGHVHNYQLSKPLRFSPDRSAQIPRAENGLVANGAIAGRFTFDQSFNGTSVTKPDGILYLVTGAGGADLYSEKTSGDRTTWPPFTAAYVNTQHSLTVLDVDPQSVTIRQLDASGAEIDRVKVTR